ncbi:MAG TPA: hypothetical protein VNV86_15240 [Candidatus Acidoferrum sp.]|jgi:hypothetical protein|nr:hypothetical protein [Candidatus Acidoferrum sp.]
MGLEIQLQDEWGGRIESIADPYGDTVFNPLQIPRFLSEWADVVLNARTDEDKTLVSQIETLARRCADEVHLYLKFIGD